MSLAPPIEVDPATQTAQGEGPWFTVHGRLLGGHWHCKMFAGPDLGKRGRVGLLTMDERDWEHLVELARRAPQLLAVIEGGHH